MELPRRDLVSDSAAGEAMTAALTLSAGDLLAYFERRVGTADAPDAVGELMVVAWRRVASLPPDPEQARMWLFGIARHLVSTTRRGELRRWRLADKLRSMTTSASVLSPASDQGSEVRDAVDRLDADSAELVKLVHWDGFTLVEAAAILQIPASTARGRYQRAKQELREALYSPAEP